MWWICLNGCCHRGILLSGPRLFYTPPNRAARIVDMNAFAVREQAQGHHMPHQSFEFIRVRDPASKNLLFSKYTQQALRMHSRKATLRFETPNRQLTMTSRSLQDLGEEDSKGE